MKPLTISSEGMHPEFGEVWSIARARRALFLPDILLLREQCGRGRVIRY